MASRQNQEKSMLKLAQFNVFTASNKKPTEKDIELILDGVDLNLKVSHTIFLRKCCSGLIGSTFLHLAYKNLNIDTYNILINKGADFNAKNKDGNTVLHESFHFLCNYRSSFTQWDLKNKEESTLINQRIPFVESTLLAHVKHNITNNPSDSNGLTHFHIACAKGYIQTVEFFLSNKVSVNQAICKDTSNNHFKGYTPLHFAAHFGHLKVAIMLLKHGASANLKDSKGRTPLHISLERNIAMIDSTKNNYCSVEVFYNERVIRLLLNRTVHTGLSLLCVKSATTSLHHTENLVSQGFNANQCISMQSQTWPGYTALHFAAHVNIDTVKLLIKYGADIEAKDADGGTPFEMCIERYKARNIYDLLCSVPQWKKIVLSDGKTKLVDLIFALQSASSVSNFLQRSDENVKLFVHLNSPLWAGFTVLHLATLLSERKKYKSDFQKGKEQMAFNPDLTVIAECLKQDADVTVKDQRDLTPVHFAFRLEREKVVELLLQYHHRMINPVDDENLSHLQIACTIGNQDLVQKLLWNGADVNVAYKGNSPISCIYPGWTPLHIAVYKENCEITKLLLKFGADVHTIDRDGFTPVHTIKSHLNEISEMLFNESNLRDFVVKDLGLSYLHVACSSYNVDAVKQLLDLGVDVNQVITCDLDGTINYSNAFRTENYDGWTPMHCALGNLHIDQLVYAASKIVSLLLERGADMLIKDPCGTSPLSVILESNNHELINVVLEALNSNEDLRNRIEREIGLTLLHIACCLKDYGLIENLLDNGADVNARISEKSTIWSGYTPLHVLILSYNDFDDGDLECEDAFHGCLKLLLERDADVNELNAKRRTPLHMAYHRFCCNSRFDSNLVQVYLMLKALKNFDVNPTSIEGISHFHIACHILEVDVVEDFLNLGDVDVNSTIDAFSGLNIAGCTPLLLTAKERDSYHFVHPESFDRLRIVDSLIKRGARVDVEDVDGNTAAHHDAFRGWSDENILKRLANAGADVNARNVRGETPLGLLVKKDFTFQKIRYFIACGCRLNAFNLVTEEGYIAVVDSILRVELDVERLLFEAFLNCPNSMKKDNMNRTAIHNIVSINKSKTSEIEYAKLFDLLMKFGYDIDDKDNLGRTALHVAAQFRNVKAVEGLFLVGADVNVTDNNCKIPFAYVFETCSQCNSSDENHSQYTHVDLFRAFVIQVRKLQLCNLVLHESNELWLSETFKIFSPDDLVGDLDEFLPILEKMSTLRVKPYSLNVVDFIRDAYVVIDYPMMTQGKRKTIDDFLRTKKIQFREKFKAASGVVQLQYRQAVLRKKIIDDAKDSLTSLMELRLPEMCSHIILRFLTNSELQNLILSTSVEGNINTAVDS